MSPDHVKLELQNEPFLPIRIHLTDGRALEVRFKHAVVQLKQGIMIFKGVRDQQRLATGYEVVAWDSIDRIVRPRPRGGSGSVSQ